MDTALLFIECQRGVVGDLSMLPALADAAAPALPAMGRLATAARAAGVPVLLDVAGRRLPAPLRAWLRTFRFGAGIGKVDYALDGPVPWLDPTVRRSVTVHVGGTRAEMAAAERDVAAGRVPDRPYVLVAQPSTVDPTRAPAGKHVLWAYTHLPNGLGALKNRGFAPIRFPTKEGVRSPADIVWPAQLSGVVASPPGRDWVRVRDGTIPSSLIARSIAVDVSSAEALRGPAYDRYLRDIAKRGPAY